MSKVDWSRTLDLKRVEVNLRVEMVEDWHHDPWAWPEIDILVHKEPKWIYDYCSATGSRRAALLDVPKENWGTRPAVVLDVLDRLSYQALVDRLSVNLVGSMSVDAFGWRLPASAPKSGRYSKNSLQWEAYRNHLSRVAHFDVALRSDLVSFFASIPIPGVQAAIYDVCPANAVTERLCSLVQAFGEQPYRSGLPQRSTASAVLANMYLRPVDDLLLHFASALPRLLRSSTVHHSSARWMDDIWLFGSDAAKARQAQVALQREAQALGLNLNSAKTQLLEGTEVARQAREVEHSAVDEAIVWTADFKPLEEMIDQILASPETASRTTAKFALRRMRTHGRTYRVQDLVSLAHRMPHLADTLASLFRPTFTKNSLEPWFLDYARGPWATHEWATAQYARMFPSSELPGKELRQYLAERIRDANTTLPLLAIAAQRLTAWDVAEARSACRDALSGAPSPQAARVLSLSALTAGEGRLQVRKWLRADDENAPTLALLEAVTFAPPKVSATYAA